MVLSTAGHMFGLDVLMIYKAVHSEALPVNNGWARLVILSLGDPHLLECAQGRKDRAANPHRVLALRRCHDLDLHGRRCQSRKLLGHALTNASEHCGTTRQDHVAVEVFTNIHIAFHDGLVSSVMDSAG